MAAESSVTHRRRYRGNVRAAGVLELLLIDRDNPRSLAFSLEQAARPPRRAGRLDRIDPARAPARAPRGLRSRTPTSRRWRRRRRAPAAAGALPRRDARAAPPARRRHRRPALRERPAAAAALVPVAHRADPGRSASREVPRLPPHGVHVRRDVRDSLGLAHLSPRELPWQQVASHSVTVDPPPVDLTDDTDCYGNAVTYFHVTEPHLRLVDRRAERGVGHADRRTTRTRSPQPWERARPLLHPTIRPDAWAADRVRARVAAGATRRRAREYAAASLTPAGRSAKRSPT